jgi:hypothetical protein
MDSRISDLVIVLLCGACFGIGAVLGHPASPVVCTARTAELISNAVHYRSTDWLRTQRDVAVRVCAIAELDDCVGDPWQVARCVAQAGERCSFGNTAGGWR